MERGARRRRLGRYGPPITLTNGGRAAGGTDYGASSGRRFPNPPLFAVAAKGPAIALKTRKWVQQVAPGYDPQVIAWQRPPLAAKLSSTARGSSPEP